MVFHQLAYAVRSLIKARGFTLAAVLSLALGIGANVAMFSVLNAVLLKPLPYPESERLVFINELIPKLKSPISTYPVRAGHVLQWRTELKSFESIGGGLGAIMNLSDGKQAESLEALRMTAELLDVLGEKPQLGRWLRRAEEENGQPDVVILSDSLWHRRFAADPHVVGRKIILDNKPHEIVGVASPGMRFYHGPAIMPVPERPELFVPLRVPPGELDMTRISSRNPCAVIGRLKRGVTLEQAYAEIEISMAGFSRTNREHLEVHALMQPLDRALTGNTRKGLLVLMAAVCFVLLIVCVNVANLLLVRGTRARHELEIRTALGASRRHLIGQSLAESFILAACGTTLGLVMALWMIDIVVANAPAHLPRLDTVALDRNVVGFSLALCVLTTLIFGFLPAWHAVRNAALGSLNSGTRRHTDNPSRSRLQAALMSAEVGLSALLLIGAGLLLASFERVMSVPRGFDAENIHAALLALPPGKYQTFEQKLSFFRRVDESVTAIPGIAHAGYANALPLLVGEGGASLSPAIKEGGEDTPLAELPASVWMSANASYFPTLGIALRAGRLFTEGERDHVAVVSETAARRIWPGEYPIGKRIRHTADRARTHWFTVIGVVGDIHLTALDKPAESVIYYPYWQLNYQGTGDNILALHARTPMQPAAIGGAIREAVRKIDPDVAANNRGTLARIVSNSVSQRRFQTVMVAVFGLAAMILAAIGVYSVVSYAMAQRQREIGVRIALGADRRDIARLVLRRGMAPVAVGMAIGLIAASGLARLMENLLFEVRVLDPLTFGMVPVVLGALAALACYGPARRSARVDPVVAIRCD